MSAITTEIFIQRARSVHGDKYDYSKVEYVNSGSKVCIICPAHGEFWKRASRHLSGEICPQCSRGLMPNHWTRDKCEVIARQYVYKKDFHLNNKLAYNAAEKHGWLKEFIWLKSTIKQTPKKAPHFYTQDEMVSLLREKLGDSYDYSKVVYRAMKVPVTLICRICDENGQEHGEFSMRPDNILNLGQGCPKCGIIKRNRTQSKSVADFILEARSVHGPKYNYDHVNYVNTRTKIAITCSIHGDFFQTPYNHLLGKGCPHCSGNAKKWNEVSCREAAKKYKYLADFRRLLPGAWRAAQENGWIESYGLEKLPPKSIDHSKSYRYIYAYEFSTYHAVYVGLTNSLIRRDWEHHNGLKKSPVYTFADEKKCDIPVQKLLERDVPVMESGEREHYWEEKYRQEGWQIINIAKTGKVSSSLGAIKNLKWTEKTIRKKAEECHYDIKRFTQKYSGAREAITTRYPHLLDELFPSRNIHTHHTIDEAIDKAKSLQCKNRSQLRKECNWAFRILDKNQLLEELYPISHHEFDKEEAIQQARTYRSIESIRTQNRPLWKYLKDNNLFKEACPTDIMFHRCKTPEEAWELSIHYDSLSDFCTHARTAYYILKSNGLLYKRFKDKRFNA